MNRNSSERVIETSSWYSNSSRSLGHHFSKAHSFFAETSFNNCWPRDVKIFEDWPMETLAISVTTVSFYCKNSVTSFPVQSLIAESSPFFFSTLLARFQNCSSIFNFLDLKVLLLSSLISNSFFLIYSLRSLHSTAVIHCQSLWWTTHCSLLYQIWGLISPLRTSC